MINHPWTEERKNQGPVTVKNAAKDTKRDTFFSRVNSKVGLGITLVVGTMWCAYAFAVIALLSLPQAIASHNLVIIVAWISSNFLQLVLLPVIIVGQNIQAKAADKRAEATYKDAEAVLHETLEIQRHLKTQDVIINDLVTSLKKEKKK